MPTASFVTVSWMFYAEDGECRTTAPIQLAGIERRGTSFLACHSHDNRHIYLALVRLLHSFACALVLNHCDSMPLRTQLASYPCLLDSAVKVFASSIVFFVRSVLEMTWTVKPIARRMIL